MQLADIPIENGILRVDKIESDKKVSFSLGSYSLPHSKGFIKKSVRKINGKEIHIIDNGIYQLATIPILGWNAIETITATDIHPETKESTVINVTETYNPSNKNNIYVTAFLWKKSGEEFTNDELKIVKKVKVKKNKIIVTNSDKTRKTISY